MVNRKTMGIVLVIFDRISSKNPIICVFSACGQFSASTLVAFYVEMMGLIGMGNNPMVGASVAVAVAVEEAMK